MPTAAKLVAAIALAVVGFFGSGTVASHLPEGENPGYLWAVAMVCGIFAGWRVLGPDAARGRVAAAGVGLRATAVMTLLVLFFAAFAEMIEQSLLKHYNGPMQAIVAVFDIMLRLGRMLGHVDVLGVLVVGGILAGLLAHYAARNWR
jgi:hypothetical protein